jgi:quercetin dioxygenase-like cupin family protein
MSEEKRPGWGTEADAVQLNEETGKRIYKVLDTIKEEPHGMNENTKLKIILTKKDDNVEITSFHAKVPKGEEIPEHTHEVHDILFPLKGKAKVWIQGLGDFQLRPGVVLDVPPKALHKLYDVEEDFEAYDIFSGAIF